MNGNDLLKGMTHYSGYQMTWFKNKLKDIFFLNQISIARSGNKFSNLGLLNRTAISILGSSNYLNIGRGRAFQNALIRIKGNNNSVVFEEGGYHRGTEFHVWGNNLSLRVGKDTCSYSGDISVGGIKVSLDIGESCLFAKEVIIRTSDSHRIFEFNGNSILNEPKSVFIGDRVWVGYRSIILKGVEIGKGSIVTAGAVVTKSFGPNCLVGGVPAKLLKENVTWKK